MVRKKCYINIFNKQWRKSVVAERFTKTLKNKIYKYMTSISKNVYIDKLDDIMNKYNNTYHRASKMKPVDLNPSICINSSKEMYDKNYKFKIDDVVRISKYKSISARSYLPNFLLLQRLKSFIRVELDLSNHATKADLENATSVDTTKFANSFT